MSRWVDASAVVFCSALLLTSGCKKKEADVGEAASSAKVALSASAASSAAAPEPSGYAKGEALSHMPKDCERGRIYIDVAAFAALAGDAAKGLGDQWTALAGEDGQAAKKAIAALRKGGFDPATSVKELAVCVDRSEDDMVFAVGMDLSKVKGDPLDLVLKVARAASKDLKAEKKRAAGLSYLATMGKGDEGVTAILGSSLVVGKDLKALKRAQQGGGAKKFEAAAKTMFYVNVTVEQGHVSGSLVDAGADLKLSGALTLTGDAARALAKDPDATVKQMKGAVDKMATELGKVPSFQELVEPLKALQLSAEGTTIKANLSLPKKSVQSTITATSEMTADDLKQLMR